jgi:glycosyltransferase involved in cell wall biosynthesis
MNIIIVHNYYQQPGGEDQVFLLESRLLKRWGHRVMRYTMHNDCIAKMTPIKMALTSIWNPRTLSSLKYLIQRERTKVVHFHNTFPLISPAGYYAASTNGALVVQTLHNFRILCPGALFFRNENICESCLYKFVPWPGVVKTCYRNSFLASGASVAMITLHRWLKTWQNKINRYIVLTEFAKKKYIQGGLPPEKIMVKPNFIHPDPGSGRWDNNYALFVGRLSVEKGIITLLNAWEHFRLIPLKIVGDGPLREEIQKSITKKNLINVEILGQLYRNDIINLMKGARFLLFPSECYEGFPNTLLEALACGLPIVASRLGSMAEIVDDGVTGLHFEPGNSDDLADKVQWLVDHPGICRRMGKNARQIFLKNYTAEKNYEILMDIYQKAIDECK